MAEVPYITVDEAREELEAAELDVERYVTLDEDGFDDLEFVLIQQRRDEKRKRYAAVKSQEPHRRPFAGRA